MRKWLAILLTCVPLLCFAGRNDSLLVRLDEMVRNRERYELPRRVAIDEAKSNYANAATDVERYNVLRDLYDLYRAYRIDSAIIMADRRLAVARAMANPSRVASATLNLAEGYAKAGASDKAISILDTLGAESLQDYHIKYRNSIYRTAYEQRASSALLGSDRIEALDKLRRLRDIAAEEAPPGSRGSYTLRAERLRDAGMYDEAVAMMEDADRLFDLSSDAPMQYTMGEIYKSAGRTDDAVRCLARSAMLDLADGVKEYRALILLASLLFENGQVRRAFEYINCAMMDADFSKASIRTTEIMKSMPVIDESFHQAEREIAGRTRTFLIIASILVVLLLLSLFVMLKEYRKIRSMLGMIADINARLEDKNEELVKADSLKQSHLNAFMQAYAGHISRFRNFRKTVFRLMTTSQFDKAVDIVRSDKAEQLDIADFHEMFDKTFLSIFPNFVQETNAYLATPARPKAADRLTPELRVAAMVRLGMTSTEEIASMLHYTTQTVYNLRSSLRAELAVPREQFDAYLRRS